VYPDIVHAQSIIGVADRVTAALRARRVGATPPEQLAA
jgi:hypothetical protein